MYKDENHYTLCKKKGRPWGYYYYDENNERRWRSTGRKTKYEAQKVINERIRKGELKWNPEIKDVTLREYAADFFVVGKCPITQGRIRLGKKLSPTTLYCYRNILVNDIFPYFGNMLLSKISDVKIREYQDIKASDGLKFKTINKKLYPLKATLDQAVKDHRIQRNPFDLIDRMNDEDSERKAFTVEQVALLLRGNWKSEYSRIAFKLACFTGMRMGEIQALRPRCFKDGMIEISESFAPFPGIVKEPKNGKTRKVPFPEELKSEISALCAERQDDQFIFSVTGRVPYSRQVIRNDLKDRMKEEGIDDPDLTFHSTRHFFDSYLYLKANVDKEKIMQVIGHSSEEMFRHYLHIDSVDLSDVGAAQNRLTDEVSTIREEKE